MMSEVAFFVKDVVGPKGAVSIVMAEQGSAADEGAATTTSSDIDTHTKTSVIRLHHADLNADNSLARPDEILRMDDEPGHDELCKREQAYLLRVDPRGSRPGGSHERRGEQPAHRSCC